MGMKALYISLLVGSLVVLVGCDAGRTGGRPSTAGGSGKAAESGGGAFKLKGPTNLIDTQLKRKEPKTVKITVDPDKNFHDDVAFTTKVDPADHAKDLKVQVKPATWKASDSKDVELHIEAADNTPQGEYTIHVTGTPAKGNPYTVDVKVKVPEKK
jgi:hypothetical protein